MLVIVLRMGISMAFFRFYFDAEDDARPDDGRPHLVLVHDGDGDLGLVVGSIFATQISHVLFATDSHANLVRAALVLLWAQMNYEQLTSLFRVEERSVSYVAATLANVIITVVATILLVAVWHKGAIGVIVGNFTGTLAVYFVLLAYRRFQLGLEFDRGLFRQMQRFGLPLVPSGLALWVIDLSDRFFLIHMKGLAETGVYSVGVRDLDRDPARADRAADGVAGLRLLDQGRRRGQAHLRRSCSPTCSTSAAGSRSRSRCSRRGSCACWRRRGSTGPRRWCRCSSSAGRRSSPST